MTDDKDNNKYEKDLFPNIFKFITIRCEKFGAFLYNPYTGIEEKLDTIETFSALLCNGYYSLRQIEAELEKRFGLSPVKAKKNLSDTLKKLENAFALSLKGGIADKCVRIPDTALFADDDPELCAPKHVIWDITYLCNMQCPHCLTSSGQAASNELDTQSAMHIIDMMADSKVFSISLSGGEPFLRSDIFTLIRHAAFRNIRVDIATNGTVITDEIIKNLNELPVFDIQISVDGIGENHNQFRGVKNAFETICNNAAKLINEDISVSFGTTITKENINELEDIIDLALNIGCRGFKAIPFLPAGRGGANHERFILQPQDYLTFSKVLTSKSRELEGKLNISTDTCMSFLFGPEPEIYVSDCLMGCSAGYDTMNIGADGMAYPCPFLKDLPLGNLLETPLKNIWRGSKDLKALRNIKKQEMQQPCSSCRYSPTFCRGGCRAAAYLKHGNLFAADPGCFLGVKSID